MTSKETLAWMAGVVDGEGSLTIAKQFRKDRPSPAYRLMITVANCDLRILQPFKKLWGGTIYTIKANKDNCSDKSQWYCRDAQTKEFLESIMPYLQGKKQQAELLLDFIEHKHSYKRYKGTIEGNIRGGSLPLGQEEIDYRENINKKIKELNAKGRFKVV